MGLTAASVWLWLRALRWRMRPLPAAVCIVLMLGSFPAVQGIKLQQLSLLVAALLAGSAACVASGFLFCGGALLALATIKPQLAWPLVAWLLVWAVSDWGARRRLVFGFGLVMAWLLAGAEFVLPGWLRMFAHAIGQYHRYTQNQSVLDQLVPWGFAGKMLSAVAVLACVFFLWKVRREPVDAVEFGRATALVLALTVLVVPMYAPYNQVLLLPAILTLVRERTLFTSQSRGMRVGYLALAFALAWQWIASLGLSGVYLLVSPAWALMGWTWPFFATFALPVLVFAMIFLDVTRRPPRSQEKVSRLGRPGFVSRCAPIATGTKEVRGEQRDGIRPSSGPTDGAEAETGSQHSPRSSISERAGGAVLRSTCDAAAEKAAATGG